MFFLLCSLFCSASLVVSDFPLTLVHHNDIHSFIVPSLRGRSCDPRDYHKCFGGIARLATAVRRLEEEDNFLQVNAGDMYQGTLWYTILKWRPLVPFTNMLSMHAMALGNHEFDEGVVGLIPYLKDLNVPIVAANVDLSYEPELDKYVQPSVIINYNNTKVGIIGYITPATKNLASPGKVKFLNEEIYISKEARKLKMQGVNIIIALGHSGYNRDKEIAKAVPLLDVVVGAHSHSFLYSGDETPLDTPEGPYPTVITQSTGRKVLVVQAMSFTKYLGHLKINFTADGEVKSWEGQPILLDNSIPEDPEFVAEVNKWSPQLAGELDEVLAETYVRLDGFGGICRKEECGLGNLFANAFLKKFAKRTPTGWSGINAGIFNAGALRATLEAGNITHGDLLAVHPFGDGIDIVTLSGMELLSMFEQSVKLLNITANYLPGAFLQVSGIRIKYDICAPEDSRILNFQILCNNCEVPKFEKIEPHKNYTIAVSNYISRGGDSYSFGERAYYTEDTGFLAVDVVRDYVMKQSPLITNLDGRIELVRDGTDCDMMPIKTC